MVHQLQVIRHIQQLRAAIRQARAKDSTLRVGFVPTMGYLHEGHASLLRAARQQCDLVVLSIFVNPLQFGPNEDLSRYPRDEQRDLALAEAEKADIVFLPSVEEMYPTPTQTVVSVSGVTERLCGESRPGHFDGVATVVSKLFHMVQPDAAYFGQKDAQQVAVIQQMVQDLNIPVQIVPCPIVREADGLALSSRNVYLEPEQRRQALVLSSSLKLAESLVAESKGAIDVSELHKAIIEHIRQSPLAEIDYVEIVAYPTLQPVARLRDASSVLIALAVKFGKTRLIDNTLISF
ncbi:pantoate--beta-alanine ligase [Paenibacillus rigui]|uniref:Pantothenate synthetase n=1 Tax=Paenibacillus rigui TaxID=554312 RepID=A0A229UYS4_9BACL|nr:pantoate--beta-alanine ligase [Paenibacillus rigui]OXM88275.1 pantoate--beta-alanine ligase [Paenibacillus rigui]